MRTNIVIDDDLMEKALAITGAPSKRAVVELGLKALLHQRNRQELAAMRGKINWVGDLDAMRRD